MIHRRPGSPCAECRSVLLALESRLARLERATFRSDAEPLGADSSPVARHERELVTERQIAGLRRLARRLDVSLEAETFAIFSCSPFELKRSAADELAGELQARARGAAGDGRGKGRRA